MQEVSSNELKLITKNYDLQCQLDDSQVKVNSHQKMLIICGIVLYILATILAVAIEINSKQAKTIAGYEAYMDQQEVELQDYSHQLFLLKHDNRLLDELGK